MGTPTSSPRDRSWLDRAACARGRTFLEPGADCPACPVADECAAYSTAPPPAPYEAQAFGYTRTPRQLLELLGYWDRRPPEPIAPCDPETAKLANVRAGDVLDAQARAYQATIAETARTW